MKLKLNNIQLSIDVYEDSLEGGLNEFINKLKKDLFKYCGATMSGALENGGLSAVLEDNEGANVERIDDTAEAEKPNTFSMSAVLNVKTAHKDTCDAANELYRLLELAGIECIDSADEELYDEDGDTFDDDDEDDFDDEAEDDDDEHDNESFDEKLKKEGFDEVAVNQGTKTYVHNKNVSESTSVSNGKFEWFIHVSRIKLKDQPIPYSRSCDVEFQDILTEDEISKAFEDKDFLKLFIVNNSRELSLRVKNHLKTLPEMQDIAEFIDSFRMSVLEKEK